jgi:methyltransferase (TIGR00027 family)
MTLSQGPPGGDRAASRTALGVATLRAAHQILDGEPKLLIDPIATRLIGPAAGDDIRLNPQPYSGVRLRQLRTQVLVRSRFAEDRLEAAVARGVRQCIVLGAGYDTFAYRQPGWARNLTIYEIDHPASQAAKRARLTAAEVAVPANVHFVPVDFEVTALADALRSAGIDGTKPAFFSWLGVMVYLTQPAIDAVFATIATFPKGSEIVFTFSSRARNTLTAQRVAAGGEPWLTHTLPNALAKQLYGHGFSRVEFLRPATMRALYVPKPRTDSLAAPGRTAIASATV